MKRYAVVFCAIYALSIGNAWALTTESAPIPKTRCGWFDNSSPGNISLIDRDGEWTIGIQGGYQVKDNWPWPKFKKSEWVATNSGSHGHGCVCLKVVADESSQEIVRIYSAKTQALSVCRNDHTLAEP
jgi:hypothetical protein